MRNTYAGKLFYCYHSSFRYHFCASLLWPEDQIGSQSRGKSAPPILLSGNDQVDSLCMKLGYTMLLAARHLWRTPNADFKFRELLLWEFVFLRSKWMGWYPDSNSSLAGDYSPQPAGSIFQFSNSSNLRIDLFKAPPERCSHPRVLSMGSVESCGTLVDIKQATRRTVLNDQIYQT
jgi:hypothetical protein